MVDLVTRADFAAIAAVDKYYASTERWDLYSAVADVVAEIAPESTLELGPYRLPIVPGGDTMDRKESLSPTYLHDATKTPWPVFQQYDVFIGLQVWEHLGDQQQAAFREVQRIAKHALLSFPYRWDCKLANPSHHWISEKTIKVWTCGAVPTMTQVIPSKTGHRRILYRFDF